jgi:hypothetical protein
LLKKPAGMQPVFTAYYTISALFLPGNPGFAVSGRNNGYKLRLSRIFFNYYFFITFIFREILIYSENSIARGRKTAPYYACMLKTG